MPFSPGGPSGPTQRRFSTTARLSRGYDTAEVDAFREQLARHVSWGQATPVVSDPVRGKRFSTHRPGYDTQQVDAFLDKAAWRLAAMKSTDKPVPLPGISPRSGLDPRLGPADANHGHPGLDAPPWSPDAADTPALLATDPGRLVDRRRARAGERRRRFVLQQRSQSATGEPEVAPAEPTQVRTGSRRPTRSTSG